MLNWNIFSFIDSFRLLEAQISVAVVGNYFTFHAVTLTRKYHTLLKLQVLLTIPLSVILNLDVPLILCNLLMIRVFDYSSPLKAMPLNFSLLLLEKLILRQSLILSAFNHAVRKFLNQGCICKNERLFSSQFVMKFNALIGDSFDEFLIHSARTYQGYLQITCWLSDEVQDNWTL